MAIHTWLLLIAAFGSTLPQARSRAVNISNTWFLPQEGFPVFYRYFRDRITWYEADAVCQFHHANLVTVDTSEQFDTTRAYLKELDVNSFVWIGLKKNGDNDDFTWTDYKPLAVGGGFWHESPPKSESALCAVIDPVHDFRWHSLNCGGPEVASFICELPVPPWAQKEDGCMLTSLPSLSVTFLPEQAAVELTNDCGMDGTRSLACKGQANREEMVRELSCERSDSIITGPFENITTPTGVNVNSVSSSATTLNSNTPSSFISSTSEPNRTLSSAGIDKKVNEIIPISVSEEKSSQTTTTAPITATSEIPSSSTEMLGTTRQRRETYNISSTTPAEEMVSTTPVEVSSVYSTTVEDDPTTLETEASVTTEDVTVTPTTSLLSSIYSSSDSPTSTSSLPQSHQLEDPQTNEAKLIVQDKINVAEPMVISRGQEEEAKPSLSITAPVKVEERIETPTTLGGTQEEEEVPTINMEPIEIVTIVNGSQTTTHTNITEEIDTGEDEERRREQAAEDNLRRKQFISEPLHNSPTLALVPRQDMLEAQQQEQQDQDQGPIEPEPEAPPRPNRGRRLTRPNTHSFYPYFLNRVLG